MVIRRSKVTIRRSSVKHWTQSSLGDQLFQSTRGNIFIIKWKYEWQTWPRVIGRSLPMGGPGRLPPNVRDEKALLYINFHLPWSLSRSYERSTGPPAASSSRATSSANLRSSTFAARPLFSPETTLCSKSFNIELEIKHSYNDIIKT